MPFYGLSRRVRGVNNTLTACTVLSIYVRMSQRTCTILCKHSRLPQGLYCHHVCRCWKPNFAANDTRFIFLLRCYPSGEHGDKHCPCLKFVLFRVILNDPSASDKWHCVWNARRCRRFCCPYFIVLQIPLTPPDCSWCHSLIRQVFYMHQQVFLENWAWIIWTQPL